VGEGVFYGVGGIMQTAIYAGKLGKREIYLVMGSGEIEVISSQEKTLHSFMIALKERREIDRRKVN
jgi:hypothetical protein